MSADYLFWSAATSIVSVWSWWRHCVLCKPSSGLGTASAILDPSSGVLQPWTMGLRRCAKTVKILICVLYTKNKECNSWCSLSAFFGKDLISLFVRFVPRDLFEIVTKKISKTVMKIILSNIYYKALAIAILMLVLTLVFFRSIYVGAGRGVDYGCT